VDLPRDRGTESVFRLFVASKILVKVMGCAGFYLNRKKIRVKEDFR
jgi:hypothetical protein